MRIIYNAVSCLLLLLSLTGAAHANEHEKMGHILLEISGKGVDGTVQFDLAKIESLSLNSITTPVPWSDKVSTYEGVYLDDILASVGVTDFDSLDLIALNGYAINISKKDSKKKKYILAIKMDGKSIPVRKKGPITLLFDLTGMSSEELYFIDTNYSLVWFLNRIIVQ